MKHINIPIKSHILVREEFDSYNEMIDITEERKYNDWANHKYENSPNSVDDWAGNISYNKAKELITHGWTEQNEKIKSKLSKIKIDSSSPANKTKLDIVGFSPCVPNVLIGVPKTMFNKHKEYKKSKVVDIVYDATLSCGIDSDDVIEKGVELLAKIQSLELSGFRVKLSVLTSYCHANDKNWYMMTVPVKNANQPMNINRVAFPIAHVSMLRILGFNWYEKLPNAERNSGYGASIYHWSGQEKDMLMEQFAKEHQKYINYYTDLDTIFKDIK